MTNGAYNCGKFLCQLSLRLPCVHRVHQSARFLVLAPVGLRHRPQRYVANSLSQARLQEEEAHLSF